MALRLLGRHVNGVPTTTPVAVRPILVLERPSRCRSPRGTAVVLVGSTFAGFTSRWRTPRHARRRSAPASCVIHEDATASGRGPPSGGRAASPPEGTAITRNGTPFSRRSRRRAGCSDARVTPPCAPRAGSARRSASRRHAARGITFTATVRASFVVGGAEDLSHPASARAALRAGTGPASDGRRRSRGRSRDRRHATPSLPPRVEGAADPEEPRGLVPDRNDVEPDGPRPRRVRRQQRRAARTTRVRFLRSRIRRRPKASFRRT